MANRKVTPLTDTGIKSAKQKDKEYTLSDGNGLQLVVKTDGRKVWEVRYTFDGKSKQTTLGTYPTTTLLMARNKRDELKQKVLNGINPIEEKKEAKKQQLESKALEIVEDQSQFHKVAYGWIDTVESADTTRKKRLSYFERYVFPHFCQYNQNNKIVSSMKIGDIKHGDILAMLKKVELTSSETAGKIFRDCRRIWFYAIGHGFCENNIVTNISIRDTLKAKPVKHRPHINDEKNLSDLLNAIDEYSGGVMMKSLLKFVSIIPLRASNIVSLKWSMVNFDNKTIVIPRSEMKVKDMNIPDFTLPLPKQALDILLALQQFANQDDIWIFRGDKNPKSHIDPESPNKALRIMGFDDESNGRKQTINSFRSTFRSFAETYSDKHNAEFITMERVLDHHEQNNVVRAYNHKANYVEKMKPLLQWWADYLDGLKQ